MARSGSRIPAIFASTTCSPSALSALSSWMRSFIAPCSSSVNPLNFLLIAVVLLADCCVPFSAGFMKFYSASEINYFSRVHSLRFNQRRWALVEQVGNGLFHEGRRHPHHKVNVGNQEIHEGRGAGKTDPPGGHDLVTRKK